jgi:hypothetical protein
MPNKYFDMLQGNIDSFGVITQNAKDSWDGGDTTQREGMFAVAILIHFLAGRISLQDYAAMIDRYRFIINNLNDDGWSLRRHPDPTKWYHDTNRMSRDQWVPNIIALGALNRRLLRKMTLQHLRRGGLFTTNTRENGAIRSNNSSMSLWQKLKYSVGLYNPGVPCYAWKLPDITDPSIWGALVRGLNIRLLWPLLLLTDWILVIGAVGTYYQTKSGTVTDDQNTQQMLLLQSHYAMPTPVAKLAMWIYKKTNPQTALDAYFAPENNGPRMDDVYREIWASL